MNFPQIYPRPLFAVALIFSCKSQLGQLFFFFLFFFLPTASLIIADHWRKHNAHIHAASGSFYVGLQKGTVYARWPRASASLEMALDYLAQRKRCGRRAVRVNLPQIQTANVCPFLLTQKFTRLRWQAAPARTAVCTLSCYVSQGDTERLWPRADWLLKGPVINFKRQPCQLVSVSCWIGFCRYSVA